MSTNENPFIGYIVESSLTFVKVAIKTEYQGLLEVGDFLTYPLKEEKNSVVFLKIDNLKFTSNEQFTRLVGNNIASRIGNAVISATRGVLIVNCRVVTKVHDGKSGSIKKPPSLLTEVFLPSKEILKTLFSINKQSKDNNEVVLGRVQIKVSTEAESSELLNLRANFQDLFLENLLIIGAYKFGKTEFVKNLIVNVPQKDNITLIIFDLYGEYDVNILKKHFKKVTLLTLPEFISLLKVGFGPEFLSRDELITSLSFKLEYDEIELLSETLDELSKLKLPFSVDNIKNALRKRKEKEIASKIIDIIDEKWSATLSSLIAPNSVTVIDFSKETQHISNQVFAINNFMRSIFIEMKRRYGKENLYKIIIIEDAEKFCPKKEYESVDSVALARENIINILAQSKLLNMSLILLSSTPSMLHPSLFYLCKNKVITRLFDDSERKLIKDVLGIRYSVIDSLDIGEFIGLGPAFKFSVPIEFSSIGGFR